MKTAVKEDDKGVKFSKEDLNSEGGEDRKRVKDEAKTRDLQLELEKSDRDGLAASLHVNKLSQHGQKQQHHHQQTSAEKTGKYILTSFGWFYLSPPLPLLLSVGKLFFF